MSGHPPMWFAPDYDVDMIGDTTLPAPPLHPGDASLSPQPSAAEASTNARDTERGARQPDKENEA